jgi:hypothetical protein
MNTFFRTLACAGLILLCACGKEDGVVVPIDQGNQVSVVAGMSLVEQVHFFDDVLRRGLSSSEISVRSEEEFSVEDGKNGIEMVANVYFSRKPANLGRIDTKENTFIVNRSSNGSISTAHFVDGYIAAHAKIVEHFIDVDFTEKQMVSTDVSIASVTDAAVEFKITTNVGESLPTAHPSRDCQDYFAPGEDYFSGAVPGQNGPCDGSDLNSAMNGTTKLTDAANQLFLDAAEQSAPSDLNGVNFLGFVEIGQGEGELEQSNVSAFDLLNPDDDILMDGTRDYLLWSNTFSQTSPPDDCIVSEDMNWYLCNMFGLATYSPDLRPQGKLPVYLRLLFDGAGCGGCPLTAHDMRVFYGTPFYSEVTGGGYTDPSEILMPDEVAEIAFP